MPREPAEVLPGVGAGPLARLVRVQPPGDPDGVVRLWDAASGREVAGLKGHRPGSGGWVAAVAYCPRGRCLASAGYDGTVRLWDPETGRELAVCAGHTDHVRALAFSPDGR